jgi:hypothetical protein
LVKNKSLWLQALFTDCYRLVYYRPSGPPYCSLNGNVFETVAGLPPSSVWKATVLGVIGFSTFDVPGANEYCHSACDLNFSHSCSSSRAVSGEYSCISVSSTSAARASFSVLVGTQEWSETSRVTAKRILELMISPATPQRMWRLLTRDTTSPQN